MNSAPSETPFVSVIIASYGSEGLIRRCLSSIVGQLSGRPFEVILVDSGKDETRRIAAEEFPQVRIVRLERRAFPGAARNIGISLARGEVVAFVDTKLELPPGWIATLELIFEKPGLRGVAGPRRLAAGAPFPARLQYYIEFFDYTPELAFGFKKFAPAGNSAVRKASLERAPFQEGMRTVEDWVFCSTWKGEFIFDKSLTATYHGASSWGACFRHLSALGWWSGYARSHFALKGSFLRKFWPLAVLLFPYRLSRYYLRFVRRLSLRRALLHLLALPYFCAGFGAWTLGFLRGVQFQELMPCPVFPRAFR